MYKNIILKPTQGLSINQTNLKLVCEIVSFSSNREDVVYYKIQLKSQLNDKEWEVNRRYSDFYDFYMILKGSFFNIPSIPNKTLSKVIALQELELRKSQLNSFLRLVINRTDIISNMATYHFLELKNHFPDFQLFQPLMLDKVEDLNQEATTLDYSLKGSLVFLGTGKKSKDVVNKLIGKFSSFISSVSSNSNKCIGQLIIYNLIQSKNGETMLHSIFEQSYPSQISYLKFNTYNICDEEANILCLGFDSGEIRLLRIYITESSTITKNLVDEVACIKAHKKPIISIQVDYKTGYVFTICEDNILNISEYNYQTNIKSIKISKEKLTCLLYDITNSLLVITDAIGSIYFYNVDNPIDPTKLQAYHSHFSSINFLQLNEEHDTLYIGTKQGDLMIFKVNITREGMSMNQEMTISTQDGLSILKVCETKEYYMIGLSNGSISINRKEEGVVPYFVIPYHSLSLGSFVYIQSKHIMISCGYDKKLLVYQLPMYFPSEMMLGVQNEPNNEVKMNNNPQQEEKKILNIPTKQNLEKKIEKLENKLQNKRQVKPLTFEEIQCADLVGWDSEFPDINEQDAIENEN